LSGNEGNEGEDKHQLEEPRQNTVATHFDDDDDDDVRQDDEKIPGVR